MMTLKEIRGILHTHANELRDRYGITALRNDLSAA